MLDKSKKKVYIRVSSLLIRNYLKRIFLGRGAEVVLHDRGDRSEDILNADLFVVDKGGLRELEKEIGAQALRMKPAIIIGIFLSSENRTIPFTKYEIISGSISEELVVNKAEMLLGISPRRRTKTLVKGEVNGKVTLFWLVDLSETGCRLRSEDELKEGEMVKIHLPGVEGVIQVRGSVVRKFEYAVSGKKVREFGVQFKGLTPSEMHALRKVLHRM